MERNKVTRMHDLQIGDRFYKLSDPQKKVWQKVSAPVKKTNYRTYKHFAREAGLPDKEIFTHAVMGQTIVVFLRSTIQNPQP